MKALVITPTIGAPELKMAHDSVINQTYSNTHHLIIVDGMQFEEKVNSLNIEFDNKKTFKCVLPFNTGGNGWYGHRIMSAFSFLTNYDYIFFLDQDNWYDENHVESLVEIIEKTYFNWCYSLRKIYDKEGNYICDDNCESLGRWEVWNGSGNYHIDTNCYCFSNNFLMSCGHLFCFGWGADRRFYQLIRDNFGENNYTGSGLYTVNYRLGGGVTSPSADFFLQGNIQTLAKYNGNYPWLEV